MSDASTVGSNLMTTTTTTGCSATLTPIANQNQNRDTNPKGNYGRSTSGSIALHKDSAKQPSGTGVGGGAVGCDNKEEPWEDSKWDDLEDIQLKDLLEEAYSYKNPRDKENKSEAFLKLLQKAENEKEDPPFAFHAITSRFTSGGAPSSKSQKPGGSLQDLIEAVHNDSFLDYDYPCNTRIRRNNHNSRPKKYSSVSSRQREGGSLPSNVNVSNCSLSVYDQQPFLHEVVSKRRGKSERTCSGTSCASVTSQTSSTVSTCGHDSMNSSGKDDSGFSSVGGGNSVSGGGDTIIDMGDNFDDDQHGLARDILSQAQTNGPSLTDGAVEMDTVISIKKPQRLTTSAGYQGKIDRTHPEQKTYVDDSVTFLRLERGKTAVDNCSIPLDEFKSCQSILGEKVEMIKTQGPMFCAAKAIPKQLDENGNALSSTFNSSSQTQAKALKKKKPQSERNTKTYVVEEVAGHRGADAIEELVKYIENTEDNSKMSKLNDKKKDKKKDKEKNHGNKMKKSNSLEELSSCTKLDEEVTLRRKEGGKKKEDKEKNGGGASGSAIAATGRKGERRSWGTEELSYLDVAEKKKPAAEKKAKKDELAEVETQSAEFHVVTKKKKKPKKRQSVDDVKSTFSGAAGGPGGSAGKTKGDGNGHKKDHSGANKSRRKSTSSMPPSEKSESSDEDSVHSLPIESVSAKKAVQPQSYADIARTVNKYGKWPAAEATSPNGDKKAKKNSKPDFPELVAESEAPAAISNSTPRPEPVATIADTLQTKQTLQKSKSMDADSSSYCNSMDQYPALEKTVKRHSAVALAPAPAPATVPANDINFVNNNKAEPVVAPSAVAVGVAANAAGPNLDMNLLNLVSTSSSAVPSAPAQAPMQTPVQMPPQMQTQSQTQPPPSSLSSCSSLSSSQISNTNINNINKKNAKGKEKEKEKPTTPNTSLLKKSKKEKPPSAATATAATTLATTSAPTLKPSNRPAVIILNDDTAGLLPSFGSEFTFGDFNEDEMKLFNDDCNGNAEPGPIEFENNNVEDEGEEVEEAEQEPEPEPQLEEEQDSKAPLKMLNSKLDNNLSILARSTKLVTCDEIESSLTAAAVAASNSNNNGLRPGKSVYVNKGVTIDFDVRFIPPTVVASVNNDRIIDFIGSAWEEVKNSAVTQFYDDK